MKPIGFTSVRDFDLVLAVRHHETDALLTELAMTTVAKPDHGVTPGADDWSRAVTASGLNEARDVGLTP